MAREIRSIFFQYMLVVNSIVMQDMSVCIVIGVTHFRGHAIVIIYINTLTEF